MIPRSAMSELLRALQRFPVVGLLGPRQVGKTTLARELARGLGTERVTYLDLESTTDQAKLSDAEPYLMAQRGRLTILDEVHRTPDLFSTLRVVVDRTLEGGDAVGHFLVLGSASPELLRQSSESLAGRILFVELTGVRLDELASTGLAVDDLWLRGGFPKSLMAPNERESLGWRDAFLRTYLERDIPQLGPRIPAETLRRLWTMLAHNQGEVLNASRLAGALAVSGHTVARYIDLLVDLLLVRRLPPWSGNVGKRLAKSPKVYVRDSGVVHALLQIESLDELLGHPVAGATWEGLVLETLIAIAGREHAFYYRTSAGAEIDILIEGRAGRLIAVDVKRSSAPTVSRGFRSACADVSATKRAIIHGGSEAFPLPENVEAVPVAHVAEWLRDAMAGLG